LNFSESIKIKFALINRRGWNESAIRNLMFFGKNFDV